MFVWVNKANRVQVGGGCKIKINLISCFIRFLCYIQHYFENKSRGMVVGGWPICLVISRRNEGPGREILQRPPVHLSVHLSVLHV